MLHLREDRLHLALLRQEAVGKRHALAIGYTALQLVAKNEQALDWRQLNVSISVRADSAYRESALKISALIDLGSDTSLLSAFVAKKH